jgi:hypothetical protein
MRRRRMSRSDPIRVDLASCISQAERSICQSPPGFNANGEGRDDRGALSACEPMGWAVVFVGDGPMGAGLGACAEQRVDGSRSPGG